MSPSTYLLLIHGCSVQNTETSEIQRRVLKRVERGRKESDIYLPSLVLHESRFLMKIFLEYLQPLENPYSNASPAHRSQPIPLIWIQALKVHLYPESDLSSQPHLLGPRQGT